MVAKKKRPKKSGSLSHGRPPFHHKPAAALSSKATRASIRSHHVLQKALAQAIANGDKATIRESEAKLKNQGGLQSYQQASIIGQSSERGGDSSKVLMQWLAQSLIFVQHESNHRDKPLRLLEIGALSKSNACSRSPLLSVTRIDLHSQDKSILQQDFMQRPLPTCNEEKFDLISLSLVLNYVPDAIGKGEMLRRTIQFLRLSSDGYPPNELFPSLFLVLPAPCVTNSRYMDERKLSQIMESLGYELAQRKMSAKLAYYLWKFGSRSTGCVDTIKKIEINPGRSRNNFAIRLA
ncbi:MAG: hypothetical protein M1836_004313 [Candelina mexicana]|nr:MAG: hypothetical protein M1836_004313 [Candelina mexicana]